MKEPEYTEGPKALEAGEGRRSLAKRRASAMGKKVLVRVGFPLCISIVYCIQSARMSDEKG
jgi:hypothetical protein